MNRVLIVERTLPLDLLQADSTSRIVDATSDVARAGLSHLADGPVFIAGGNAERAARSSAPDRAAVVLGSHEVIKRLTQMRP